MKDKTYLVIALTRQALTVTDLQESKGLNLSELKQYHQFSELDIALKKAEQLSKETNAVWGVYKLQCYYKKKENPVERIEINGD